MKKLNKIQLIELSNILNKLEQLPDFDKNQNVIIYLDDNNNFLALESDLYTWGWTLTGNDTSKINNDNTIIVKYTMLRKFMHID